MITEAEFASGWRRILRRFNRKMNPDQAREYHAYLSRYLDDDQFRGAVDRIWADDDRFPKPNRFRDAAPPRLMLHPGQTDIEWRVDPFEPVIIRASRKSVWGIAFAEQLRERAMYDNHPKPKKLGSREFPLPAVEWID
jgi:hypothetical protein